MMINGMYNCYIQSYALYRGLFRWLNWPGYISSVVIQPFAHVIMFTLLGRFSNNPDADLFIALGITVMSMGFIIINGLTQSYNYDRNYGTIQFLFASPASRLLNYISRSILHFPNGILACIFGLLAGLLIVGINFSAVNWGGFIISVCVISFSLAAFGQLLGVAAIVSRNWVSVVWVSQGIVLMLTGMVIPISVFPQPIQGFSKILPVTNGLFAMRGTFAGAPLGEVSGDLLREVIVGMVYFVIAYICLLFFERVVKNTGSLDREAQ
jgi:ABC-2 type transport system permease protein